MKNNEKTQGVQKDSVNAALDDPHNVLLNEKQAAAFVGLTERTLQQRRYCSQPPAYIKLPGSSAIRYRLSTLMAFVAEGERSPVGSTAYRNPYIV